MKIDTQGMSYGDGKGDGSLHEENGYWFRVTEEFYDYVMEL